MLNRILNLLYLLFFLIFLLLLIMFYSSEKNIIKVNKFRSIYSFETINEKVNLIILKNDTENIIDYKDDLEIFKKNKKKYEFMDLINK